MIERWYLAAAYSEHAFVDAIASRLRSAGHEVVSTWHEQRPNKPKADPEDLAGKRAIWQQCKKEVRAATHLAIYTGNGNPRGAYVELGYFLALCEESLSLGCVYWISSTVSACPVPVGDPLVDWCESASKFLEVVRS